VHVRQRMLDMIKITLYSIVGEVIIAIKLDHIIVKKKKLDHIRNFKSDHWTKFQ
jgi:hypothetical protein